MSKSGKIQGVLIGAGVIGIGGVAVVILTAFNVLPNYCHWLGIGLLVFCCMSGMAVAAFGMD